MSEQKLVLGYWAIRGLAQPIRLLLEYAGLAYDDVTYSVTPAPEFSREAWLKVKFSLGLDFPNLPYLIDGDFKITESGSILRYIAGKAGLGGATPQESAKADMVHGVRSDLMSSFTRLCYGSDFEQNRAAYEEALPGRLEALETFLGDSQWVAGGDKPTYADFSVYEMLDQFLIFSPTVLDAKPKLKALHERVHTLPAIAAYRGTDRFIERPLNNLMASFK